MGVPQGSVIGPVLFVCYTTPVQDIIHAHGLSCMMYADDTQLYITMKAADRVQAITKLEACLHDVRDWMRINHLILNDSKMEVLHLSSPTKRVLELPLLAIGDSQVPATKSARDLGVILDSHLSMRRHVNAICYNASLALRRLGKIRHFLCQHTTEILVHAFISSLLDNCNSLLTGLPERHF